MTASSFNLILSIYLSLSFPRSHGMGVVQTDSRTDGVAAIVCECTAEIKKVQDVRLNEVSLADNKRTVLCQKGSNSCNVTNIYMLQDPENPKKWLFFINQVEAEDMNRTYECEFTVSDATDFHDTWIGKPATLLQGQKEAEKACTPPPPPPPSPSPASQPDLLGWVLIGLLALLLLCLCLIIHLYIRLRKSKEEYDNGTYVEMRKAPLLRNTPAGVYCGNRAV